MSILGLILALSLPGISQKAFSFEDCSTSITLTDPNLLQTQYPLRLEKYLDRILEGHGIATFKMPPLFDNRKADEVFKKLKRARFIDQIQLDLAPVRDTNVETPKNILVRILGKELFFASHEWGGSLKRRIENYTGRRVRMGVLLIRAVDGEKGFKIPDFHTHSSEISFVGSALGPGFEYIDEKGKLKRAPQGKIVFFGPEVKHRSPDYIGPRLIVLGSFSLSK